MADSGWLNQSVYKTKNARPQSGFTKRRLYCSMMRASVQDGGVNNRYPVWLWMQADSQWCSNYRFIRPAKRRVERWDPSNDSAVIRSQASPDQRHVSANALRKRRRPSSLPVVPEFVVLYLRERSQFARCKLRDALGEIRIWNGDRVLRSRRVGENRMSAGVDTNVLTVIRVISNMTDGSLWRCYCRHGNTYSDLYDAWAFRWATLTCQTAQNLPVGQFCPLAVAVAWFWNSPFWGSSKCWTKHPNTYSLFFSRNCVILYTFGIFFERFSVFFS